MKFEEIEKLIVGGESETLEFKKSTGQLSEAARTLCAFLNASGGTVLIGVSPQGKVVGQQVSDSTQQSLAEAIRKFEPPAPVEIGYVEIPDSPLQVIVLNASLSVENAPFTWDGRPYQRVGTATSTMPQERYQQLLLNRMHSRRRWENESASGVELESLDREEIARTIRVGISAGRLPETASTEPAEVLDRLVLRTEGKLLNAAVVLFGTRFLPDYPQCQLRMARFKGTDRTEFLDNRQIMGHGFELLEEATLFLQRHLPVAGRIQPGLFEREDEPLFPPAALREALVNALCHRDYTQPGGAVSLAIYDDRLEIWNDGTLPRDLSVEDLKRDHPSRPRTPLIADVFYKRGLVERWGRGTQKIVELCVAAGHPEPEFVERAGTIGVRFLPSGYIAPHRVVQDLTNRQREILQIIADGETPLRRIMEMLSTDTPRGTVRDDLNHLKRLDLVEPKGRGMGAVWSLKEGSQT